MARGAYVGVGNTPHKVKKILVNVNGEYKKVKKGYVGVGGVPKLFFTSSIIILEDGVWQNTKASNPLSDITEAEWHVTDSSREISIDHLDSYFYPNVSSTTLKISNGHRYSRCEMITEDGKTKLFMSSGTGINDAIFIPIDRITLPQKLIIKGSGGFYYGVCGISVETEGLATYYYSSNNNTQTTNIEFDITQMPWIDYVWLWTPSNGTCRAYKIEIEGGGTG